MASSRKKNSKYLKRRRSQRRRSMKRKIKGGCGCGGGQSSLLMKGGGDYFLTTNPEPPSFNNLPINHFYSNNTYEPGTDVIGAQIPSRLIGGDSGKKVRFSKTINKRDRKSKKQKVSKIMKGGIPFSFMNSFSDPLMGKNMDPISSQGGVAGAMMGSNIVGGIQQNNYNPMPVAFSPITSSLA